MPTRQKTRRVLGVMTVVTQMQHFIDARPNAKPKINKNLNGILLQPYKYWYFFLELQMYFLY